MIFFSFFTAPTVFRELPREVGSDFISKIFSQYYMLGYACLSLSFASLLLKGWMEKPFPFLRVFLMVLMLGCTFYAGVKIHPQAHQLKQVMRAMEEGIEKEEKQKLFSKLHRQSVILNIVTLVSGLTVLVISFGKK